MWIPTETEEIFINLIMSMCTDCLMGQGTADKKAFVSHLEMMAADIGRLSTNREPPDVLEDK